MMRERGILLTLLIVLPLLGAVQEIYALMNPNLGLFDLTLPLWLQIHYLEIFKISSVGIIFVHIVASVGLWFWKKWGVYLLTFLLLIGLLVSLYNSYYFQSKHNIDLTIFSILALPFYVLIYWIIKRKWHYFE